MSGFGALLAEAIRDAVRRRIVAGVVIVCVLSVMMLDTCTSCGGEVMINGEMRSVADIQGGLGGLTIVVLGLWVVVLAGVLAADHLRETLEDGSARMSLARPVARATFAFARLAGALSIALATGVVLLGAASALLAARSDLPVAPALGAAAACAVGSVVVASFAMAASLVLPRMATVLLVFAGVGMVVLANVVARLAEGALGVLGAIDRFGPPFASALAAPLAGWVPDVAQDADEVGLILRLLLWAVLGLASLAWGFRRSEL